MSKQPNAEVSSATASPERQPRSSKLRYLKFVGDYRARRLDEISEKENGEDKTEDKNGNKERPKGLAAWGLKKGKRREYLREYLAWLWPYRFAVVTLAVLALMTVG